MNTQRVVTREDIAHRVARIAGHATSLKRLWEEERGYDDMLIQIAAVRGAGPGGASSSKPLSTRLSLSW